MKILMKSTLLLLVLSTTMLLHAGITVGNNDGGNCYPFMCNDSGTSTGVSIDYQQAYVSTAFSGTTTISTISWNFASAFGGNDTILGGNYSFYWGYSSVGLGLGSTLSANYTGAGATFLGTASVPAGGSNYGNVLTLSGFAPFSYDPTQGDLILEIVVDTQDNVGNGTGNGYNQADYTGAATTRAYCLTNVGCTGATTGALVTTFNGASTVPEPGTLAMFGTGIVGLAGVIRRKLL